MVLLLFRTGKEFKYKKNQRHIKDFQKGYSLLKALLYWIK